MNKMKNLTTAANCVEHVWPRSESYYSSKSAGSTAIEQCNCCLAVRVSFSTHTRDADDNWVRVKQMKVVEPDFE